MVAKSNTWIGVDIFPVGSHVVVRGLQSAPQFNDARGEVLHYDLGKRRYGIQLAHPRFQGKELLCRRETLELVYALIPQNLRLAQASISSADSRLSFEDCANMSGHPIGRALVARSVFEEGELVFVDYPFIVVSGLPGQDSHTESSWAVLVSRFIECFFAVARQAQAGSPELLSALTDLDIGSDMVVNALIPDARQSLRHLWSARRMNMTETRPAKDEDEFEREARGLATMLARWRTNQHKMGEEGRELYWMARMLSHSCAPNLVCQEPDDSGLVQLRALRRIAPGDILAINYMDDGFLNLAVGARRAQLSEDRCFHCVCDRCCVEASECRAAAGFLLRGGSCTDTDATSTCTSLLSAMD